MVSPSDGPRSQPQNGEPTACPSAHAKLASAMAENAVDDPPRRRRA